MCQTWFNQFTASDIRCSCNQQDHCLKVSGHVVVTGFLPCEKHSRRKLILFLLTYIAKSASQESFYCPQFDRFVFPRSSQHKETFPWKIKQRRGFTWWLWRAGQRPKVGATVTLGVKPQVQFLLWPFGPCIWGFLVKCTSLFCHDFLPMCIILLGWGLKRTIFLSVWLM